MKRFLLAFMSAAVLVCLNQTTVRAQVDSAKHNQNNLDAVDLEDTDESVDEDTSLNLLDIAPAKMNFIKLNALGLLASNIGVQYERVLSKRLSVGLTLRFMPMSRFPFQKSIAKSTEDTIMRNVLLNTKVSGFSFSPELRYYWGTHGWARGAYIAPFYRYSSFSTSNFNYRYNIIEDSTNVEVQYIAVAHAKVSAHAIGFLLGKQWFLGKHFALDLYGGLHFGLSNFSVNMVTDRPLASGEQKQLLDNLNDLEIPWIRSHTASVSNNDASLNIKSYWGGVRFGLAVGYRF